MDDRLPNLFIFLDIDGVLNSSRNDGFVEREKMELFDRAVTHLLGAFDVHIYFSSAWRVVLHESGEDAAYLLKRRCLSAGMVNADCIRGTIPPWPHDRQRSMLGFIENNRRYIDNWLAVDDLELKHITNHIRTDFYMGFTLADGRKMIRLATQLEEERRRGGE